MKKRRLPLWIIALTATNNKRAEIKRCSNNDGTIFDNYHNKLIGKLYSTIIFCIIVALCISCNTKKDEGMVTDNSIYFNTSKSIVLSLDDAKLINKDKINLAFSDSTLIPAYSNILIADDNIIVFSQRTNEIFRFDKEGNFKNLIGKRGNGPGEFQEMNDIIMSPNNKKVIELLDNKSIHKYSIDGEFLSKKEFEFPAFSFVAHNDCYWFYLGDNPASTQHKLIRTNSKFSIQDEYFPILEDNVPLVERNFGNSPIKTFRESLNYNLYTLGDDIELSYNIDFGKYKIPKSVMDANPNQMVELLGTIEYANVMKYIENANYSFLYVMKYNINEMPDFYYWIINKNTKEEKLIQIDEFNEESYLLYPEYISEDDKAYFIGYDVASAEVLIDPNSNPEIVKIGVKEFFKLQ